MFKDYKEISGYCTPKGAVGEYGTHKEAIINCNKDGNCQGIVDEGCDFLGPFTMCVGEKNVYTNSSKNCLYKKNPGME